MASTAMLTPEGWLGIRFLVYIGPTTVFATTGTDGVRHGRFTALAVDEIGDIHVIVGAAHIPFGLGGFFLG
jgi:hypothetical protein